MRNPASVEALCQHLLDTHPRLDFIINNACQTVRRPPEFYAHMMEGNGRRSIVMPAEARRLLGVCDEPAGALPRSGGSLNPRNYLKFPCWWRIWSGKSISSPKAVSTRICNRWICEDATHGAC